MAGVPPCPVFQDLDAAWLELVREIPEMDYGYDDWPLSDAESAWRIVDQIPDFMGDES